ncbi:MAG: hypothetical protein KKD28_08995 [Chloroflexi bacterium]|nr:hypothetical protein [Chloroflexota bacterium]MBU1661594.1 hypothetical protein [Chloroflexota bacterium]
MDNLPLETQKVILQDAVKRDTVTARRKHLLEILWGERYLTRAGLIARVEAALRKGCFGESAWEDTFYRDMRVVKQAFHTAGYVLAYSRSNDRTGYYLRGQANIDPVLRRIIGGAAAEVNADQVAITRQLQPWERVQQGFSITDLANQVVAYRRNQREVIHA